jgi:hypothetical protein
VREVLANQLDLRQDGLGHTPVDDLAKDHRYWRFQAVQNGGTDGDAEVPSEQVIRANRAESGTDYRHETEGPNPVIDLRAPEGDREEELVLQDDPAAEHIPGERV